MWSFHKQHINFHILLYYIGGRQKRFIKINENQNILKFNKNDKCANKMEIFHLEKIGNPVTAFCVVLTNLVLHDRILVK
jgi:hypothetical protein